MKFPFLSRGFKTSTVLLFSCVLAISSASAELKVAMVDMTTLLNNYHKTKTAELEDKVNRDAIQKGAEERTTAMKDTAGDLRKLELDLRDPQLSQEKRQSIAVEAQGKKETFDLLKRERDEFLERSSLALERKTIGIMDEIRAEVVAAVQKYAAGTKIDYVFDESGLTKNQVPFIVFVRNRVDITADVLKLLNQNTPEGTSTEAPTGGE